MPKRYTPTSAAADVEAALRLLEGRWKLVDSVPSIRRQGERFSDLERAIPNITQKCWGSKLPQLGSGRNRCAYVLSSGATEG